MALPVDIVEARAFSGRKLSGKLAFRSQYAGESLTVQYLNKKGQFDQNAYEQLTHFFRCRHANETAQIDPKLFFLLDSVRCQLKAKERSILLFSGYRSKNYNRLLKASDAEVAKNSYHTKGMAADISIDGVSLKDLRRAAKSLRCGGIGNYDDFVHLDVGPVRYW